MGKVRVSAISYLNTIPFVYGLNNSDILSDIDMVFDTPAACAAKLINNEADLGIVPVAVVPQLESAKIISDFCIGANGAVRTVVICSNVKAEDIETLYLDPESRTSVLLAQILMRKYWRNSPVIKPMNGSSYTKNEGFVLIGDKVFDREKEFKYTYDLASVWKEMTGMPFVFAVWVAVKPLLPSFIEDFNKALQYGVSNITAAVSAYKHNITNTEAINYLSKNISYDFDSEKQKALNKFWKEASDFEKYNNLPA